MSSDVEDRDEQDQLEEHAEHQEHEDRERKSRSQRPTEESNMKRSAPSHLLPSAFLALAALVAGELGVSPIFGGPFALSAQAQPVEEEAVPQTAREAVVTLLNDPATLLFEGGGRVPEGRVLEGDVAALQGPFYLAGRIVGDLLVVNGDLTLAGSASVTGDVLVVGGGVEQEGDPDLQGSFVIYEQRLRYSREGGEVVLLGPVEREADRFAPSLGFGQARLTVRAGTNYNRVEGLPVMFGPIVETQSSNPLRLDALAVWRSESGFSLDPDEMGYRVGLEQYLGGREIFSIGATATSLIEPMDRWALGDLEASLATFLFHRDYRDYHEREGWSAFARVRPSSLPLELTLEYGEEEHEFVSPQSPWSLVDNEEPWRPQPLVAEGRLRRFDATAVLDTRNDRREPTHGWWIEAGATFGMGGSLRMPETVYPVPADGTPPDPGAVEIAAESAVDERFAAGFLDARRYNRVGPSSELLLRTVLGGSLSSDPLPPQFQHALGGEGTLPGFPLFSVDCGARRVVHGYADSDSEDAELEPAFARYGCDRMALFQAEFRMDLGWTWDLGDSGPGQQGWSSGLELRPRWAAFLDAGRGWAVGGPDTSDRFDESSRLDVGLGLMVNNAGLYLAFPLTGDDKRANLFIRVQRRF